MFWFTITVMTTRFRDEWGNGVFGEPAAWSRHFSLCFTFKDGASVIALAEPFRAQQRFDSSDPESEDPMIKPRHAL